MHVLNTLHTVSWARVHTRECTIEMEFQFKNRLSAFLSSVCVYVFVYFFFAIDNFVFFFSNITIEFTIGVNARHSRSFTD